MGNICCSGQEEQRKRSALQREGPSEGFLAIDAVEDVRIDLSSDAQQQTASNGTPSDQNAEQLIEQQQENMDAALPSQAQPDQVDQSENQFNDEQKQLEALRLEQERLEMIVQAANRKMVPVRSSRGSNAYYDQGFAAALSQHLEQTTKFRESVNLPLPNAHPAPVLERLSQPAWDGIPRQQLGRIMNEGESPNEFFDRVAEALLNDVVPEKERLFADVDPIVESLL
ncbi:hypothetical protein ACA910_007760 [Epithemia clementina (nom. ined.)]